MMFGRVPQGPSADHPNSSRISFSEYHPQSFWTFNLPLFANQDHHFVKELLLPRWQAFTRMFQQHDNAMYDMSLFQFACISSSAMSSLLREFSHCSRTAGSTSRSRRFRLGATMRLMRALAAFSRRALKQRGNPNALCKHGHVNKSASVLLRSWSFAGEGSVF